MAATKEICIVVANDDPGCRNIVFEMLRHCSYEVLYIGKAADALNAIWDRKDKLDLVLTIFHRSDTTGTEIRQHIHKEFKLSTLLMSPPGDKVASSEGQITGGLAAYTVKYVSMDDINNLWEHALARETKGTMVSTTDGDGDGDHQSVSEGSGNRTARRSSCGHQKGGRKEPKEVVDNNEETRDQENNDGDGASMEKKPRVAWTDEMHKKFLEAIEILGNERAFPKKIMEIMNVRGLTRENVASHLQKHRMSMKRKQEDVLQLIYNPLPQANPQHPTMQQNWASFFPGRTSTNPFPLPSPIHSQRLRPQPLSSLKYPHTQSMMKINCLSYGNTQRMLLNPKFRVYGDETKHMLVSIANDMPSDSNTNSSSSDCSYMGFRLAGDGKTVEFGEKGVSRNDEIGGESMLSGFRVCGNENLEQYPSISSAGNKGLGQFSLISSDLPFLEISENESSFQLLGIDPGIESSVQCISTMSNLAQQEPYLQPSNTLLLQQQQHSLPLPATCLNESIAESDSRSIDYILYQEDSLTPVLDIPEIHSTDQVPMPTLLVDPQSSPPPEEDDASAKNLPLPSDSTPHQQQQQQQQEEASVLLDFEDLDSFGVEENGGALHYPATSTSSPSFWDSVFDDDTVFSHT